MCLVFGVTARLTVVETELGDLQTDVTANEDAIGAVESKLPGPSIIVQKLEGPIGTQGQWLAHIDNAISLAGVNQIEIQFASQVVHGYTSFIPSSYNAVLFEVNATEAANADRNSRGSLNFAVDVNFRIGSDNNTVRRFAAQAAVIAVQQCSEITITQNTRTYDILSHVTRITVHVQRTGPPKPVSYTHLTLPTKRIV